MTDGEDQETGRRQRLIAIQQCSFREANEGLERIQQRMSEVILVDDFICECSDVECTARIGLTVAEYEELRSVPTHFAVRHGHVSPEAGRVVSTKIGYTVVETFGAAAAYAILVNPRRKRAGDGGVSARHS